MCRVFPLARVAETRRRPDGDGGIGALGAATVAAFKHLAASGFLHPGERVVLFNTGSGLKYIDVVARYLKDRDSRLGAAGGHADAGDAQAERSSADKLPASHNIGGIIQPF